MIRKRDYYKRVLTVHSEFGQEEGKKTLLEQFRATAYQEGFNGLLQKKLRGRLEQYLSHVSGPQASSLSPACRSRALDMLAEPAMILCDCPKPPYGSREKLRFMPEPGRVLRNYISRASAGERVFRSMATGLLQTHGNRIERKSVLPPRDQGHHNGRLGARGR